MTLFEQKLAIAAAGASGIFLGEEDGCKIERRNIPIEAMDALDLREKRAHEASETLAKIAWNLNGGVWRMKMSERVMSAN